jgi:hypothetical protein
LEAATGASDQKAPLTNPAVRQPAVPAGESRINLSGRSRLRNGGPGAMMAFSATGTAASEMTIEARTNGANPVGSYNVSKTCPVMMAMNVSEV